MSGKIQLLEFKSKRKILETLLYGKNGIGVFIREDCSVEIRGLVDFSRFNNDRNLEKSIEIVTTISS